MHPDDSTQPERLRRPGAWSVVPNHTLIDRRLRKCSTTARFLNVAAWIHSNAARTDGEISAEDFRSLAGSMNVAEDRLRSAADELVRAGVWTADHHVIDYFRWNYRAEQIDRRAADSKERVRRWREEHGKVPPAPPSKTEGTEGTEGTGTERVHNAFDNALPDGPAAAEQAARLRAILAASPIGKAL